MYEVCVAREFSSAHFLRDYRGKCAEMHGHNWKVEVSFRTPQVSANGIAIDFYDMGAVLDGLIERLDHGVINNAPPFDRISPTSENLARWLYEEIARQTPAGGLKPYRVRVWETPDAYASYWDEE